MDNNLPVFDFLGFALKEASFKHTDLSQPKTVSLRLSKSEYNPDKKMNLIGIDLELNYINDGNAVFRFEAAFAINDDSWMEKAGKETVNSVFMATAFPFLRSKIFDITSDVRPGVFLPTIDLRQTDVTKGVLLTLKEGK